MRSQNTFLALLIPALLALPALGDDAPVIPPVQPAAEKSDPPGSYDALFTEILQNLPEKNRAKVDSARAKGPESRPRNAEDPSAPVTEKEVAGKRAKAMEKLSPEVKERVEKAIRTLDNRSRERELEF